MKCRPLMCGFQLWEIPQEEAGIGKAAKTVHIFRRALQLRCGKIDPHMRNNSLPSSTQLYLSFWGLAVFTVLAFCPWALHAQCSDDTDPNSLACQIEDSGNSSTKPQEAPAVFNLSGPAQSQPGADVSSDASAVGSLAAGSSYTERPSREG